MFDTPEQLALGFLTGVVFGFLLQKGHAAKHGVIVGQLLLRDWTVAKIMGTAIAVGAVLVHLLAWAHLTELSVKPAELGGVLVGALLFGVGLAVLGYCPGTSVVAAAEGKLDAAAGIAGMAVGAVAYVVAWPAVKGLERAIADLGPITWPQLTRSPAWPWVAALGAALLVFYIFDRRRHPRGGER